MGAGSGTVRGDACRPPGLPHFRAEAAGAAAPDRGPLPATTGRADQRRRHARPDGIALATELNRRADDTRTHGVRQTDALLNNDEAGLSWIPSPF